MQDRGYISSGAGDTSYRQSFKEWQQSPNGQGYMGEPATVDTNENTNVGDAWVPNIVDANTPILGGLGKAGAELPGIYHHFHVDAIPNPMGLSRDMLTTGDMNTFDPSAQQGL